MYKPLSILLLLVASASAEAEATSSNRIDNGLYITALHA